MNCLFQVDKWAKRNGCCARKHWCRAWTNNARSSCDISWDRAVLGHFSHQHTSILHEHLTVKRFVLVGFRSIWQTLKKNVRVVRKEKKIITGVESGIYAHEPDTKQKSTMWAFEAKSNVSCLWKKHFEANGRLFLQQNWSSSDCSTWAKLILSGTPQFLWRNSEKEQEKTNHCSQWQCKLSHIGSNQKRRIDGLSAAQRWLGTQWLLFISAHQENIAWSTVFTKHQVLLN